MSWRRSPAGSLGLVGLTVFLWGALAPNAVGSTAFTVAGGPPFVGSAAERLAVGARLQYDSIAELRDGSIVIAQERLNRVLRVAPNGRLDLAAGSVRGTPGYSGDTGPATAARLSGPTGVDALADGGYLIADSGNRVVRRVSADGRITTAAGTGAPGSAGDGGPATAASVGFVTDVSAADDGGFLLVGAQRVRRVSPDGTIETVGVDGFRVEDVDALSGGGFVAAASPGRPEDGQHVFGRPVTALRVGPDAKVTTIAGGNLRRGDAGAREVLANAESLGDIAAMPDGTVSFAVGGLVEVDRDGRVRLISRSRRLFNYGDGRTAPRGFLEHIARALAATRDGSLLVGEGPTLRRLVPVGRPTRAIAIVGVGKATRVSYRAGVPTRTVRLEAWRHGRRVATATERGRLTGVLAPPRRLAPDVYLLRLVAQTSGGRTLANSVAIYPAPTLSMRVLRLIEIVRLSDSCRRMSARRIDCRQWVEDFGKTDEFCLNTAYTLDGGGVIWARYYGRDACRGGPGPYHRQPVWEGPREWVPLGQPDKDQVDEAGTNPWGSGPFPSMSLSESARSGG